MPIEPSSFSRFNDTPPVIYHGKETFGMTRKRRFIQSLTADGLDFFLVNNESAGRPDLISAELYGNPFYAWTLIDINHAKDAIGWPKTGQTILFIPRAIVLSNL